MASFRDTLQRLFTRNVVITRTESGKLKVLDFNKAQSQGSPTTYGTRARWRNGRNINSISGYGSGFTNEEIEALRKQMYIDYELMDTDALVSSAVDVMADESTTVSETGELLVIKTDDEKIKRILHNLFYDILNIEFNLWSWLRTTCKYGDFFLYLQLSEKLGVVNVMPVHPSLIIREEGSNENPDHIRFRYDGDYSFVGGSRNYFEQYEIAHFRLLSDTNFLPYGRSVLEGARKEFKRWSLMEDSLLLNRITRAPERRVFKIEVGNLPPEEIDAHIQQNSTEMKKQPYIDPITGDYDLRFNLMNSLEDFFLPVRGGESGTAIETLPGLQNDGMREDVEYFKGKMLAALKIPKAYLGYDDEGGTEKASLSQQDIRFARTIERIQKVFVSELYKIALTHLAIQGFEPEDLINFELTLTNPSLIFERQKTDVLTAKVDLAKSAREENPLLPNYYIYKNIFGFSDSEIEAIQEQIIETAKFAFRIKQISEEGNDPKETGKSFGTPHDIATMQVASKFQPGQFQSTNKGLYTADEREENEGKPDQHKGSFETNRDKDFGRDPLGRREMEKMESVKKLIKTLQTSKYSSKKDNSSLTMLNENSLLDEQDIYN